MLQTFTFFPDGDFWPTSVGILPESDGMHNLGGGADVTMALARQGGEAIAPDQTRRGKGDATMASPER